MECNVKRLVKQASKFGGKNEDDFLKQYSKLRVSLSVYSKLIFKIVQGSQQPSYFDNNLVLSQTWG